jgi:hypothetical protein
MNARALRSPRDAFAALVALALSLGLAAPAAFAQSTALHGRLELQEGGDFSRSDSLQAALGLKDANDAQGDVRLIWDPSWGRWSLSVQTVMTAQSGPPVFLQNDETTILPTPPSTWFDLSETFFNERRTTASAYIDRLSVAYSTPSTVVRVGRQALTWGSGLVFRPMDLFDPFSPAATDTEYKPGVDMVYVQRLFANGSDLQVVLAPRSPRYGAPPTTDDSSIGLHYQTVLFGHRTTWLLARDHGDWVGALGVNGPLNGATWNLEVVPTGTPHEGVSVSAIANLSDSMTLFGRNATVFAEYFRNGFGVIGTTSFAQLPAPLKDHLERGQVFNTRRDYLAEGLSVEVNPLFTLAPTFIADLDDGSLFLLATGTWSLSDNLILIAGVQAPIGRAGTEFGGLPLVPGGTVLLAAPARIYLQIRQYF